jgi:predicted nucleic acid-binding protein
MVFVDTGAWFARFVPDAPNHTSVASWLEASPERLLTTDYCVDETLTLLVARKRPGLALDAGRFFLEQDLVALQFVSPEQIRRAWLLFQRRASANWSFTDCTSKIVIDDLGIKTAVALDAHFQQFGIVVVP